MKNLEDLDKFDVKRLININLDITEIKKDALINLFKSNGRNDIAKKIKSKGLPYKVYCGIQVNQDLVSFLSHLVNIEQSNLIQHNSIIISWDNKSDTHYIGNEEYEYVITNHGNITLHPISGDPLKHTMKNIGDTSICIYCNHTIEKRKKS